MLYLHDCLPFNMLTKRRGCPLRHVILVRAMVTQRLRRRENLRLPSVFILFVLLFEFLFVALRQPASVSLRTLALFCFRIFFALFVMTRGTSDYSVINLCLFLTIFIDLVCFCVVYWCLLLIPELYDRYLAPNLPHDNHWVSSLWACISICLAETLQGTRIEINENKLSLSLSLSCPETWFLVRLPPRLLLLCKGTSVKHVLRVAC